MALTEAAILDVLDRSAAHDWPDLWGVTMTEYHALRLVAVRARDGDSWGVAFDALRGSLVDEDVALGAGTWTSIYGSHVPIERHLVTPRRAVPLHVPEDRDQQGSDLAGVEIVGPAGVLRCDSGTAERLDLRPGRVCNLDRSSESPLDVLLIRAYLAAFPGSLWPPIEESVAHLGIDGADVVVSCDAFHHVLGPSSPVDREDLRPLSVAPSASPTYRSLAAALASRDSSRFVPGTSNLDWRCWAVYVDGSLRSA